MPYKKYNFIKASSFYLYYFLYSSVIPNYFGRKKNLFFYSLNIMEFSDRINYNTS